MITSLHSNQTVRVFNFRSAEARSEVFFNPLARFVPGVFLLNSPPQEGEKEDIGKTGVAFSFAVFFTKISGKDAVKFRK